MLIKVFVEIMYGMHSGSIHTSMLVIFNLVRKLISVYMYGMRSRGVIHRHLKQKVVVKHTKMKILHYKYALTHVYLTVRC